MTVVWQPGRSGRLGLRTLGRVALVGVATLALVAGAATGSALSAPGDDPASAKLAEWGRDHGLGSVVTALESLQYKMNPPATGGTPDQRVLAAAAHVAFATSGGARGGRPPAAAAGAARTLPRLVGPVRPALPGEGVFVPAAGPDSAQFAQVTYVRPDTVHTSYLATVLWLARSDRFVLHPGAADPGPVQQWTQPDRITPSAYAGLVATFNSGFKMKDARGGYYDHGRVAGSLTPGAASLVIHNDGHLTIGSWGTEETMTPDVAFVRQNLKLLIDHGRIASNINTDVETNWGATLGGAYAVWRSGIGVTASGDVVYVAGDALTAETLAQLLHRAGAVEAMQLDINRAWVSVMAYRHHHSHVVPTKLGTFQRPAARYLSDTSRDFLAVYQP